MTIFIGSALRIYVVGVMTVLTDNFTFDFLLDLISMKKNYLLSVPNIKALLLSFINMINAT